MRFLFLGGAQAFASCKGGGGRIRFANSATECNGAVVGDDAPKRAKFAKRASGKSGPGQFGKIFPQRQPRAVGGGRAAGGRFGGTASRGRRMTRGSY